MLEYTYIQQSSLGSTRVPGRTAFVQVDKYNMASIILLSIHSYTVYLPTLDDYYYDTYYNNFLYFELECTFGRRETKMRIIRC